jgi:hypothetical protein
VDVDVDVPVDVDGFLKPRKRGVKYTPEIVNFYCLPGKAGGLGDLPTE